MDTSKEYIKMCFQAEELLCRYRVNGKPETWVYGDVFSNGEDVFTVTPKHYPISGFIWLPRQDQLQDMVFKDKGLQTICTSLEHFSKSEVGAGITIFGTMEQLWLAFVMKKLHNKTWDSEEWVV